MVRSILAGPAIVAVLCSAGCTTSLREYVHNGFKVGPNYCPPAAAVADRWIDAEDKRLHEDDQVPCRWWTLFNDPVLDRLIGQAYQQNLTLKEAGARIIQARALLGIAIGEIFPQAQYLSGSYSRNATNGALNAGGLNPVTGDAGGAVFTSRWAYSFNLAWELDFWGRYRRAVTAAEDTLQASCADYDAVTVTLLGDVAANYTRIRTDQKRIQLLKDNVKLQRGVLDFLELRLKAGFRTYELDVDQAKSTLAQTEAGIPQLEIDMRQASDALCMLLGIPPMELVKCLGKGSIPTAPAEIAVGLPCELLRRRPDVVRAERVAAAQAEQIGIAETDLYPMFTINGSLGYAARDFKRLFSDDAFAGGIGPSFQWNLLNYGRIRNNVRFQEARFCELVYAYRQAVLRANQEVEDALVTFLRSHERTELLGESVDASQRAVNIVIAQFKKGAVDFNRYALIAQNLVLQEDAFAQAQGQIAAGLIAVYRALGGGWEIRCGGVEGPAGPAEPAPAPPEINRPSGPERIPLPAPGIPEPTGPLDTIPKKAAGAKEAG